ncbi:MAG: tRNA dihydrouridine synthase DusB [Patescibacteria group bacterium]|nr:tRNA dihydrouridine synthase DusB [Patescibacteria group bacterium]MDD5490402.1 tRNA dihydrouridine synthase DusB [Patescibacteria group bacterium]
MILDWRKIKKPIIALAPMADITDEPFSLICKKMGAEVIFREMVSAEAIVRGSAKTLKMCEFKKSERPIIQQIFGKDPQVMARAAKIIAKKFRPDGIDINMGCPAKKIIADFNGASLMRDPKLAAEIIREVKKTVSVPVSVKTRTGWSDEKEILEFSKIIEKAGGDLITIHGRTKKQGYSGKANWQIIGEVKKQLAIPVILNGDIFSAEDAQRALEQTRCDGIMIARGAIGNPWIFRQTKNLLNKNIVPQKITAVEIKKIVLEHAKLHLKFYGQDKILTFRKHLVQYFKGVLGAKKLREKLVKISTLKELEKILKETR